MNMRVEPSEQNIAPDKGMRSGTSAERDVQRFKGHIGAGETDVSGAVDRDLAGAGLERDRAPVRLYGDGARRIIDYDALPAAALHRHFLICVTQIGGVTAVCLDAHALLSGGVIEQQFVLAFGADQFLIL